MVEVLPLSNPLAKQRANMNGSFRLLIIGQVPMHFVYCTITNELNIRFTALMSRAEWARRR